MTTERQIWNEGGINWAWFTELEVSGDSVRILCHYRLHKFDPDSRWSDKCKNAPMHPSYHHSGIWKESHDGLRVSLEYNVPGRGWLRISNPMHIFDYPVNSQEVE